ncbi:MAG TPA: menaquinone reductase multiheme cytochrome c subunit QrcA [Myxococcota bacterium]
MSGRREQRFFLMGVAASLTLGWVGFPYALYERVEQPFNFSHRTHAGETVALGCEDCHAFLADGRFAGIPRVETCAACHEEVVGESADEKILVDEYIRPGREIPWHVYSKQPENVEFPHAVHVRLAEIACQRCHGAHAEAEELPPVQINRLTRYSRTIEAGLLPWPNGAGNGGHKMTDCTNCHRDRAVEETCLDCHK